MKVNTKKNYNKLALQGLDFDDMEFVKQYNLDPSLAYTPKLNFAVLEVVYNKNVDNFINEGMDRKQAQVEAGRLRKQAKDGIKKLLT